MPALELIFDPFFGAVELYDLSKDPHETTNLIDANPEVAARLTATLLVMEQYYPGGWCIAWRGAGAGKVQGRVRVESGLIEALAHNFYPEIDTDSDSLVAASESGTVRFASTRSGAWKGVEVRMAGPAKATLDLRGSDGASRGHAGKSTATLGLKPEAFALPLTASPDQARVDRSRLRDLFLSQGEGDGQASAGSKGVIVAGSDGGGQTWSCLLYWLEPGSEPAAKAAKAKELKKQLKAIGYIE